MDVLNELQLAGTIETLTIIEAALLLPDFDLGDPSLFQCEDKIYTMQAGLMGKICALYYAILRGEIRGYRSECDENRSPYFDSSVFTSSAQVWIYKQNAKRFPCKDSIFTDSEKPSSKSDPLDTKDPRFAAKLAASIRAWQAVTDPGKKSPKQAIETWLRTHAADLGLTDRDGRPVNQAIQECAKIANWRPGGGAPPTPGE